MEGFNILIIMKHATVIIVSTFKIINFAITTLIDIMISYFALFKMIASSQVNVFINLIKAMDAIIAIDYQSNDSWYSCY